jgi:NADH-quinone oxidoreductase subunit G
LDVWRRNSTRPGKKDIYHEVDEFITGMHFEHKDPADWVIEGPREFEKIQ